MDGTIGGLILTCIVLVYFFEELGLFFCVIALIAYLGTDDDTTEVEVPETAAHAQKNNQNLVERVPDSSGDNNTSQKNGPLRLPELHKDTPNAEVRSDKGQERGFFRSAETPYLKVVESCDKTRHFKFTHNGTIYDISCGTAYKTKVE